MSSLTESQILALAPDERSVKAGIDLANLRKWSNLGSSDRAAWGECQGSGIESYRACYQIGDLAFKCNCPSRKFPCKHGLALLLINGRNGEVLKANFEEPDWVAQWINQRVATAERRAKKEDNVETTSTPDPVAKAKRQADRAMKVDMGLIEFRLWLQDRIRQGLAGLEQQSYSFWDTPAARLTDAQAPGLARQLRQCAEIPGSGEGWQERLLERFALMHMAAEAYTRAEQLPEDLQHDLRTFIGFTYSQEEVLKSEPIRDIWQVVGQRLDIDDRLKVQRTWLRGEKTRQCALLLNFAFGTQSVDISLQAGFAVDAELCFYPSATKMRALVRAKHDFVAPLRNFVAYENFAAFQQDYAAALACNPWLEIYPVCLNNVQVSIDRKNKFYLVDRDNVVIPTGITGGGDWQLLALTGGQPFRISGEWNGEKFLPLGVLSEGIFHRVDPRPVFNG